MRKHESNAKRGSKIRETGIFRDPAEAEGKDTGIVLGGVSKKKGIARRDKKMVERLTDCKHRYCDGVCIGHCGSGFGWPPRGGKRTTVKVTEYRDIFDWRRKTAFL